MIWKYAFGWLILAGAAILNGAIRQMTYKPVVGDLAAHQISTLTGIILLGFVIWGMTRLWPIKTSRQAWTIGFAWLGMTVCFEFLFGHYVMGHPWASLLHDYNIFEGRVWIIVLLWTVIAPYLFYRLAQRGIR